VITKTVAVSLVVTPASCGNNNGEMKGIVTSGVGSYHFVWRNALNVIIRDTVSANAADSMINVTAGNYTLTVFDNIGGSGSSCNSGAVAVVVTNTGTLDAHISASGNVTCPGAANGSATFTIVGGVSPFTINWSNGASNTFSQTALNGGTYTITVSDGAGCIDTAGVVISEPLPFNYVVTPSEVSCNGGADGGASVVITGGTAPYDYSWYDETLTTDIADNMPLAGQVAGNYVLYLNADGNGCADANYPSGLLFAIGQPNPLHISSFTPSSASIGSLVTISGTGFTGATAVKFNGTTASFVVDNDGQISVIVPFGATTGVISVTRGICGFTNSSATFTVSANITFNLHAYIEGYYVSAGQMTPTLMNQGVSANASQVDTIRVELRDQFSPATVVASTEAILDINGNASFSLPGSIAGGSYYVAIFHRNSIQTWSAAPISFTVLSVYNLASSAASAYGSNLKALGDGNFAIFSGDYDQSESVDIFDFPLYDFDNLNFGSGYLVTDINGDGGVDIFDFPVYDANNLNFVSSIHP
jgi:hypothetical protein